MTFYKDIFHKKLLLVVNLQAKAEIFFLLRKQIVAITGSTTNRFSMEADLTV